MRSTRSKRDGMDATSLMPVAAYARMSTDHQRYSIDNQTAFVRGFASANAMTIAREYADPGEANSRSASVRSFPASSPTSLRASCRSRQCSSTTLVDGDASRKWMKAPTMNSCASAQVRR